MVRINYIQTFREALDSFIQKEFIEYLAKVEEANQKKLTDKESVILMKGFEMGLLIGVKKVMDNFPDYKDILTDMLKEVEQAKLSTK